MKLFFSIHRYTLCIAPCFAFSFKSTKRKRFWLTICLYHSHSLTYLLTYSLSYPKYGDAISLKKNPQKPLNVFGFSDLKKKLEKGHRSPIKTAIFEYSILEKNCLKSWFSYKKSFSASFCSLRWKFGWVGVSWANMCGVACSWSNNIRRSQLFLETTEPSHKH